MKDSENNFFLRLKKKAESLYLPPSPQKRCFPPHIQVIPTVTCQAPFGLNFSLLLIFCSLKLNFLLSFLFFLFLYLALIRFLLIFFPSATHGGEWGGSGYLQYTVMYSNKKCTKPLAHTYELLEERFTTKRWLALFSQEFYLIQPSIIKLWIQGETGNIIIIRAVRLSRGISWNLYTTRYILKKYLPSGGLSEAC